MQNAYAAETDLRNTTRVLPTPFPGKSNEAPVSVGPYEVRLARAGEFHRIFRLRYDIFYKEMGARAADGIDSGYDTDAYDEVCDHLVICSGEDIVGTYRLLPLSRLEKRPDIKERPHAPYSQSEFDLSPIRQTYKDDEILELGRSCIHPDHRNGNTARMLWAGIAKYMVENQFRALIGCVSVHGASDENAHRLGDIFRARGYWDPRFDLKVQEEFATMSNSSLHATHSPSQLRPEDKALFPPLLKGYLNLGAKVCGGPAHDADFHCHDFLILLDSSQISAKYFNALVRPFAESRNAAHDATTQS